MTIQTNHRTDTLTPSTGGLTVAGNVNATNTFGFENRIINGAMQISQAAAGASVTVNTGGNFYPVDRFACTGQATDGVFTVQQSTTAPTRFKNSILATVTTADASVGATQQYLIQQFIEGYNVADLGWGAAGALSVTLSFWVRSSLTGTFGGSIVNSGFNRSYPFTFTISAANTWELKTITIPGDTSGTWLTDNGVGMRVIFSLGAGSSYVGTAGAWEGAYDAGATGQTQVISTNGATFYVAGVQLEKGSTATSFDYRPYGTELALCQRYYEVNYGVIFRAQFASGFLYVWQPFKVQKRATPTMSLANTTYSNASGGGFNITSTSGSEFYINASTSAGYVIADLIGSSEL